jgi:glycosyltransferase involved in cell wall biosynthesis
MKKTPPISVVMPVYNAERYLSEAVESILSQTFRDFEFIVLDDESEDGSWEIVNRFAQSDSRICPHRMPHAGYVRRLNEGLDLARGQFVARMDADDVSLPNRFEEQIAYLQENLNCVTIGCGVVLCDPDGDTLRSFPMPATHDEIMERLLNGLFAISHPGCMFRRDCIRKIGGYREELSPAEDLDLFLRLGEQGRLHNLESVLLKYRRHESSVGYAQRSRQIESTFRAVNDARTRRGIELLKASENHRSESSDDSRLLWGWWALGDGNVATARKHARAALIRHPVSLQAWRLAYCALRGR